MKNVLFVYENCVHKTLFEKKTGEFSIQTVKLSQGNQLPALYRNNGNSSRISLLNPYVASAPAGKHLARNKIIQHTLSFLSVSQVSDVSSFTIIEGVAPIETLSFGQKRALKCVHLAGVK
jgi:hypothetical protein